MLAHPDRDKTSSGGCCCGEPSIQQFACRTVSGCRRGNNSGMVAYRTQSGKHRVTLDADDRGPAEYFHGRTAIRTMFRQFLAAAERSRRGTTFLVQGAPGAGKTALLDVLSRIPSTSTWMTVHINARALHDPAWMARELTLAAQGLNLAGSQDAGPVYTPDPSALAVKRVLLIPPPMDRGLLLILDEAQTMLIQPKGAPIPDTLNAIHNGGFGYPVVLLAGGLSNSKTAFATMGVSRFRGGNLVNLGRLSGESERAVIRDWLVLAGGARGDVDPWIDAISKETQGWPHHIVSYGSPAAQLLKLNGGTLPDQDWQAVLNFGRQRKREYYEERASEIALEDLALLGGAIRCFGKDRQWSHSQIVSVLEVARNADPLETKGIVETMLAKGILAGDMRTYHVPIPSMEDWLQERFAAAMQASPDVWRDIFESIKAALRPAAKGQFGFSGQAGG